VSYTLYMLYLPTEYPRRRISWQSNCGSLLYVIALSTSILYMTEIIGSIYLSTLYVELGRDNVMYALTLFATGLIGAAIRPLAGKTVDKLGPEKVLQATLEDIAVIIYTSGTTGKPKGVMLSYKNVFSNIVNIAKLVSLSHKDRFIVYLPMFHTFTLTATVLLPLYIGAPIVVIKSIFPFSNILKQVLLKRVTIFMGVPEVYNALSKAKLPWYFMWFNKLRAFVSGGAPLPEVTLKKMREKFPKVPLLEGYGLSEASPVVSFNRLEKQKPLSVGLPLPDYDVKIVNDELIEVPTGEVGEIIVKGDNIMKGYYKNPEATEQTIINGWLLTGDLGYIDEEGFLYIVDRKKDLIISKGINIYPREIEEEIAKHPAVEAVAIVGKKDEIHGEIPVAFIQLKEDEELTVSELKSFLKDKLANYKIPKHFYFLEELPKNATGKVLKRVLREKLNKGEFDS
ncbi:MAG TPA: long-chain-fatty-acid--CoA ligase, partial [Hydrogenothermaceae bacterium]|nr:long-chain-fatty-acid--CoA ligase [Hydrogenothermaceae bacterium]